MATEWLPYYWRTCVDIDIFHTVIIGRKNEAVFRVSYYGYDVMYPDIMDAKYMSATYRKAGYVEPIALANHFFRNWKKLWDVNRQWDMSYVGCEEDYKRILCDFVANIIVEECMRYCSFAERIKWCNEKPKYPLDEVKNMVIARIVDAQYKEKKAKVIQRGWRNAISNPNYKLCRERLIREYNEFSQ